MTSTDGSITEYACAYGNNGRNQGRRYVTLSRWEYPKDLAMQAGNTRRGHWFATHTVAVNMAMTKERLINSGFYDLATAYQSVHVNY